jgi:hypothetical protein
LSITKDPSLQAGLAALDCEDLRLSLCECANARQVTDHILSLPMEKKSTVIILL